MTSYMSVKGLKIALPIVLLLIAGVASLSFLLFKQHRDMAAVGSYINRLQPALAADPRFKEVRLLGYSCDYLVHPYIPVTGRVATPQDYKALETYIHASKPPIFLSVKTIEIGTNH